MNYVRPDPSCDIAPLLGVEIAVFHLPFRAGKSLTPMDVVPAFRSRLGAVLKARFCLFPDYRNQSCRGCGFALSCGYVLLFKPGAAGPDPSGDGPRQASSPRPYTLALALPPGRDTVGQGEEGALVLTLIGEEAVRFRRALLESLFQAAAALRTRLDITPLPWAALVPSCEPGVRGFRVLKGNEILHRHSGAPLSQWISALPVPETSTHGSGETMWELRFTSPVRLKRISGNFIFVPFLRSIIARLRDLKRTCNTPDTDMGAFPGSFFDAAARVRVSGKLEAVNAQWFSRHRNGSVPLKGLQGRLKLKGDMGLFIPLLGAGFFLGVGAKTVYGLGRFELSGWDLHVSDKG